MTAKQQSQSESKRDAERRRRAAQPRARFVFARCDREVEQNIERDLTVLRRYFDFRRLAAHHPVRSLWTSATSRARFELHHLADDLWETLAVPGYEGLVKRLVENASAYADYRYELRMAAGLARPKGQRVVRLAGPAPGPDIEIDSPSGHRCGIACYRASSSNPALLGVSEACHGVTMDFMRAFALCSLPVDVGLEVIFPKFPAYPEHLQEAKLLLNTLWTTLARCEFAGASGVVVRRVLVLTGPKPPDVIRRARIRFLFPVPKREDMRTERHILDKLLKETESWAGTYDGICVLAVEESEFSHGLGRDEVLALLDKASSPFRGVLSTQLFHNRNLDGSVHGFELVTEHFRPSDLRFSVETFGLNQQAWTDSRETVLVPQLEHASEFWDVWQDASSFRAARAQPLHIPKRFHRIPLPQGQPTDDPLFRERLERAFADEQAANQSVFDD